MLGMAVQSSPVKRAPMTASALVTPKRDRADDDEETERKAKADRDAKTMRHTLVDDDLNDIFDPAKQPKDVEEAEDVENVDDVEEVEDEGIKVTGMRKPDRNIRWDKKPAVVMAETKTLLPESKASLPPLSLRSPVSVNGSPMSRKFMSNSVRTYKPFRAQVDSVQMVLQFEGSPSRRLFEAPRRVMPVGTVGLRNLGNFCYMNASLQAVMVFGRLMKEVCDEARVWRVQQGMAEGKEPLCGVLRKFWLEAQASSGQVLSAARIKAVIESSNAQFVGNDQEDAHEFFSTFINLLEDEYRETTKEKEGPVFQHFSMSIQHTQACQQCGQGRSFEEPFLDLSLEHVASDEAVGVSVLLQHFMQTERDLEWKCPKGCADGRATLAHCMVRSPRILLLQVKRFATSEDGRSFVKIKNPVEVPEYLDLTPVMQAGKAEGYLYQLRAVVVHRGETIRGGHYICFARKDEQWFRYNDAVVDKCTSREAFESYEAQRDAYMLFYARADNDENVV